MDSGLIFTPDYYLKEILRNLNRIHDEKLKDLIGQIKTLTAIGLSGFCNEIKVDTSKEYTATFSVMGESFSLKLEQLKPYDEIYKAVMDKAKVNLSDLQQYEIKLSLMEENMMKDDLTGLYNRRKFDEDISNIKKEDLDNYTFIVGDANFLKMTNDTKGHQEGDKLIIAISTAIKKIFGDRVYRIGGDEFFIITDIRKDYELTEKIESVLKEAAANGYESAAAFGYAICSSDKTSTELFYDADQSMRNNKAIFKQSSNTGKGYVDDRISPLKYAALQSKTDDFIYNLHRFTVSGRKYQALVAPLSIEKDNQNPIIFAYIKDSRGMQGAYVSDKNRVSIDVVFEDESLLIRGRVVDGEFLSTIITSGKTLEANIRVEDEQKYSVKPDKDFYRAKGHFIVEKNDYLFHAVPLSQKNNDKGICAALVCVESKNDGAAKVFVTNHRGNTTFEGMEILSYYDSENKYRMEVV